MELKARDVTVLLFTLQVAFTGIILLNVPILRQITGFLLLTVIPGILLIHVLKLHKLDGVQYSVLVVGLSVSFLLLSGIVINNSALFVGYTAPLSLYPLLITYNAIFVVLGVIGYIRNAHETMYSINVDLNPGDKLFLIPAVIYPFMSVIGATLMNNQGDNSVLFLLLLLIPLYLIVIFIFNEKISQKRTVYPAALFLISLSVILLMGLRSDHILGSDTQMEYMAFIYTLNNMFWSSGHFGLLDSCLSISMLPSIFSLFLAVPNEFLFKILYALLYSVSPLIIFAIVRRYVQDSYAFLAAFFFISQPIFILTVSSARTVIAFLFFELAIMVLFNREISTFQRKSLVVIFMASSVISHYSTSLIFFTLILGTWIGTYLLRNRLKEKRTVTLDLVVVFGAFIYVWYAILNTETWPFILSFINNVSAHLSDFFMVGSRGEFVQTVLGAEVEERGIAHTINLLYSWITYGFVAIGLLMLTWNLWSNRNPTANSKKGGIARETFGATYMVMIFLSVILILTPVVIPFIGAHYSVQRILTVALTILSVFFVLGGVIITGYVYPRISKTDVLLHSLIFQKYIQVQPEDRTGLADERDHRGEPSERFKKLTYVVILAAVIPFFLSSVGVIDNLAGSPRLLILNSVGIQDDLMYVHDTDAISANWLNENSALERYSIAGDLYGSDFIVSQGLVLPSKVVQARLPRSVPSGYIYLRQTNVIKGKFQDITGVWQDMRDIKPILERRNGIYSNGESEVYL